LLARKVIQLLELIHGLPPLVLLQFLLLLSVAADLVLEMEILLVVAEAEVVAD
jgi:hypothetical protein